MINANIIGQAGKLIDLVNYQEGSIVSKEIIKNEKGTVTLFAFDKGQGLSEHTAPFDALVYNFDRSGGIRDSDYYFCGNKILRVARRWWSRPVRPGAGTDCHR